MGARVRGLAALLPAALVALAAAPASAQSDDADASWEAPRTAWGDPDLQGTWPLQHLTGTPLQRPEQYGERRFLTDEELAARDASFDSREGAYEAETESGSLGMGHWVEWGDANRLTSLIVEPANGRLPALTEEGERLVRRHLAHGNDGAAGRLGVVGEGLTLEEGEVERLVAVDTGIELAAVGQPAGVMHNGGLAAPRTQSAIAHPDVFVYQTAVSRLLMRSFNPGEEWY